MLKALRSLCISVLVAITNEQLSVEVRTHRVRKAYVRASKQQVKHRAAKLD